jgi:hypothetical protein
MLIRSKIASIVSNMSLVTGQTTLINDAINIALNRVYQWNDWPYYLTEGVFSTTAPYTTGTAAVASGGTLVTITTGVVSIAFAYRKIRFGGEKTYYRIIDIDIIGNTVTLDAPYSGSALLTSSYSIYQDEYLLAPDVDKYKTIRQMQNGVPLLSLSPNTFDGVLPTPQNQADPLYEVNVGTMLETYSIGSVSATAKTITGVATSWRTAPILNNVGRMSLIRIGNNVYTIQSVDSDTEITTYETVSTAGAGSSYEITLNNVVVQLYFIPNASRVLKYRYFRLPVPMANDYDIPDMPHEFHWLLIYGALSMIYLQKGDANKSQETSEARFLQGLEMMKLKLGTFAPNRVNRRKSIDNLRRRRFEGVENSSYDWRYSAF